MPRGRPKKVIKTNKAEKVETPENIGVTPPKKGDIGSQLATIVDESE